MRIALYQPDIPQNAGTILRLAACFGLAVDVVEPCGFLWDDRRLRRSGMDYLEGVSVTRHRSWEVFRQAIGPARLVLLSSQGSAAHHQFAYRPDDILLLGRESAGVPDAVRDQTAAAVRIPMRDGFRSLNVAVAAALVVGEALRQTNGFP